MRSPIEDANAGTTRIAQVRQHSPTITANTAQDIEKRGSADLFNVAGAVTEALGVAQSANAGYQKEAAAGAALRQGAKEGVNEIDKANKRTGFMEALFGQDAGYATALNIATSNASQNMYLEQLMDIEQHADKTPDEYGKYLKVAVSDQINEKYKDDPEAQQTAQLQWIDQSRKLAREQAANHMVYTQQQTYAEGVRDLTQQFDDVTLNLKQGRTEAAHTEATRELAEIMRSDYRYVAPDGTTATSKASRSIQLEVLDKQLSAGNSAVWKSIPDNFREGLSVPQMRRLDGFQQKYDNAIAREGELTVEEGILAAEQNDIGGLQNAIKELYQQHTKLSGSDTSLEKWTEDKRRLAAKLDDTIRKAAADSVDHEDMMKYYTARENSDAGKQGEYYSKKAEEGADDAVVVMAATLTNQKDGVEPPKSMGEAINTILHSPEAMARVATKAEQYGSLSKPFAEAIKKRVLNLQPTETGYLSAVDIDQLDSMVTLYDKAPGAMRNAVGEDASALVEITLSNSRQPVKEIMHKRAQFIKNKSIKLSKTELNIPSEQTMGDYVKQQLGAGYLDPAAINHYEQQLQTGYKIYDGDTRAAVNYMKQQFNSNNQHWKGKVILNAGLRKDANIPQALNFLENSAGAQALIATQIPATADGKPITSFSQLNDVQFRVNPSTEELIISSSQFSYPIVIREQTFAKLAEKAAAQEEQLRAARVEARNAILKPASSQFWPNPTDKPTRPKGMAPLSEAEKVGPTKGW